MNCHLYADLRTKEQAKMEGNFIPVSEDDAVNLDRLQYAGKEGLYFLMRKHSVRAVMNLTVYSRLFVF